METSAVKLTIDGKEVLAPEGATILEAARRVGVRIPTLCHHQALSAWGGCRLCVVEVDGAPRLAASCVMPVRQGMKVVTTNERIIEYRRTILEFLFSERSHYCMFCAQSGDCELQSLAYEHQVDHLSLPSLDQDFPVDTSHPDLVLDHNRCVLCGRCVRACRELAGNSVLGYQNRGGRSMIVLDLNGIFSQSTCSSCGLCLQVCPTGAIFGRHRTHYAVKGKSKDWEVRESICAECGLLCSALYTVRGNNLLKIDGPLPGQGVDRGQLCRKGRFAPLTSPAPRLLKPLVKDKNGAWQEENLDAALATVAQALGQAGPENVVGLVSSRSSSEELARFKDFMAAALPGSRVDTLDGGHFRNLAAARETLGVEAKEAPLTAITEADFILLVGAEVDRTDPIVYSLIRRAMLENKTRLAVLGLHNPFGPWASVHLPAEGDGLALLLKSIHAEVDREKNFWQTWASKGLGRLVDWFHGAKSPLTIIGQGLTGLRTPDGVREALHLARSRAKPGDPAWPLIVLKPCGNSSAAWDLGLGAKKALNGRPAPGAGLLVLSGEGDLSEEVKAGLKGLKFLAAVTPYRLEDLSASAQVLIPKPTWLEADGTYALADGSGSRFHKMVLSPPPGAQPAEAVLEMLSRRLGRPAPVAKG